MNIDRLNQVATALETEDFPPGFTFNMDNVATCTAGLAVAMFDPYCEGPITSSEANKVLGLTDYQADRLFFPNTVDYDKVTPQTAAQALRTFIKTEGRRSWT